MHTSAANVGRLTQAGPPLTQGIEWQAFLNNRFASQQLKQPQQLDLVVEQQAILDMGKSLSLRLVFDYL